MTQPALFDAPSKPRLGPRQQLVYQAILDGGFLTDVDAGLLIHTERGCRFCRPGVPCRFAAGEGRDVLRALRPKVGLVRRKTGVWQLRDSSKDFNASTKQGGDADVESATGPRSAPVPHVGRGQAIGNERDGARDGQASSADRKPTEPDDGSFRWFMEHA